MIFHVNEFELIKFADTDKHGYLTVTVHKNKVINKTCYKNHHICVNRGYVKRRRLKILWLYDSQLFENEVNRMIKYFIQTKVDATRVNFKTFEELIDQHIRRNNIL